MQTHQTKHRPIASTPVEQTTTQQRDAEQEELLDRSDELLDEIDDVLEHVAETDLQLSIRRAREALEEMLEEDLGDLFGRVYFSGFCGCA